MENVEIARVLEEMADLLEIQGANPFRIRAYRNAARFVEGHGTAMRRLVAQESDLTELPSIGKDMAAHIRELVETGKLSELEKLHDEIPVALVALMGIPGVGPKKAKKLWDELGLESMDDLEKAAKEGRVAEVGGFGERSQEKILRGIAEYRRHQARFRLSDADQVVVPLLEHLEGAKGIRKLEVAGSYRRRKETVGDLDILVVAAKGGPVVECFTEYPTVDEVLAAGETKASVRLASGLQVDLRIVPMRSYGAALVYFTGSKEHNIRLRQRAVERGLRISEYGVFEATDEGERDPWAGKQVAGRTEQEVYKAVDLPWIPPELREDRGEIAAAEKGELPDLIELNDIRGDLQMHSTWSDGKDSIEEMLTACRKLGYEYLAITDHSKALPMTGGLDAKKLRDQWKEMEEVAARHDDLRLFRSMEIDILADGRLDLEDELLAELDIVLVAVHSRFDLPAAEQTERILRAVQHPEVSILAHPTARRINRRDPMDYDIEAVLECCAERGVAVELNANPERLDLMDTHLMLAKRLGCMIVISTDAHSTRDLRLMRYGVEQARRAWLEPGDVLNTLPVGELEKALRR